MKNTNIIGDIAELKVATAFMELGYTVLFPQGSGTRYDLVVDINNNFIKIQVKSSKIKNKVIMVSCKSTSSVTGKSKPYTLNEIDYIASYCADNDSIYLIKITNYTSSISLRIEKSKNNQNNNINNAKDYLFENSTLFK